MEDLTPFFEMESRIVSLGLSWMKYEKWVMRNDRTRSHKHVCHRVWWSSGAEGTAYPDSPAITIGLALTSLQSTRTFAAGEWSKGATRETKGHWYNLNPAFSGSRLRTTRYAQC